MQLVQTMSQDLQMSPYDLPNQYIRTEKSYESTNNKRDRLIQSFNHTNRANQYCSKDNFEPNSNFSSGINIQVLEKRKPLESIQPHYSNEF